MAPRRAGREGRLFALTTYTFFKFLHVLMAIVAVGFNASYAIWLARAAREPEHQSHVLRGIKVLDDRFANPAYGLLLVTGLVMVWVGDLELTQFWLAGGLTLYVVAVVLGLFVYTPTLRRQIQALETGDAAELQRLSARGTAVGVALAVDVIVIVFLMVAKPTL
jgi:uncharacterized membrane protein